VIVSIVLPPLAIVALSIVVPAVFLTVTVALSPMVVYVTPKVKLTGAAGMLNVNVAII